MLGPETQILVSSIGWALVHFLWQGTLITLAYWVITRNIQSIHAKYWTGMLLVVISLLVPIINSNSTEPTQLTSLTITSLSGNIISPQQLNLEGLLLYLINASLPYIVMLWSLTVLFLSIRLIKSWMQLAAIKHECDPKVSSSLKQYIKNIAIKLDLPTIPLLKISNQVLVPAAYGVLKPTILLPVSLISQIPKDQLEAIIKHELCHLKRNDFVHNIIQLCADILLFFHPGIRWMNNDIRHIREQCCDQMVLAQDTKAITYAKALTNIAAFTNDLKLKNSVQLGINDGMLLNRVKFLLQKKSSQSSLILFLPFILIIIFGLIMLRPSQNDSLLVPNEKVVNYSELLNNAQNGVAITENKKRINYNNFYPKIQPQNTVASESFEATTKTISMVKSQNTKVEFQAVRPAVIAFQTTEFLNEMNQGLQATPEQLGISLNPMIETNDLPTADISQAYNNSELEISNLSDVNTAASNIFDELESIPTSETNTLSSFDNTVSIKPLFKKYVAPEYPQHFWYNQIEQDVIATFKILPNGRAYEIILTSQNNNYIAFEQEVEKAMKRWRFNTDSLNNSTLQRTYQQIFSFAISDDIVKNCELKTTGTRLRKPMPCNK